MNKSLNERLDAAARLTGIPQLAEHPPKRRPMRGLAIVSLLLGTTGLIVAMIATRWFWIGEAVQMIGFGISVALPAFGPIKPWASSRERIDEYDEKVRANAYLTALPVILIAGAVSLYALPTLAAFQHRNPWETIGLCGLGALYLILLWNAVPTLHASLDRPPSHEDDEG